MTSSSPTGPAAAVTGATGQQYPRVCMVDDLVAVAERVCGRYGAVITDHAALAAAAAVPAARINGVFVHRDLRTAAWALAETIEKLAPLDRANDVFAVIAARVYLAR
ncbi:TetR family transcriptional regulator [Corynebacterium mendelii]|uniref:Uncharacterized protein n=1 Tax=Corynebacterium mendelii TaxID=2765362 RepID=A0A939IXC3_9CORY|nr:hypothetical protein [Corynebacterium mendelii]MBN9644315.1 hypothetical protein [Corynebacterium mendelii]